MAAVRRPDGTVIPHAPNSLSLSFDRLRMQPSTGSGCREGLEPALSLPVVSLSNHRRGEAGVLLT